MCVCLLLLWGLMPPASEAQTSTTTESRDLYLFGTIIDAQTRQPIPFVQFYSEEGLLLLTSDEKGFFFMPYKPNLNTEVTLQKVGYFNRQINIDVLSEHQTNPELIPTDWPTNVRLFTNSSASVNYYVTAIDERFVPDGNANFLGVSFAGLLGKFEFAFADRWLLRFQAIRQNYDLARATTTGEVFSRLDQQYRMDLNYLFPINGDIWEILVRQGFLFQHLARNTDKKGPADFLDAIQFRQSIYVGVSMGYRLFNTLLLTGEFNYSPISFVNIGVESFPKGLHWLNAKLEARYRFWRNFAASLAYHHTTWFDPNRQYAQQYNGGTIGVNYEW